MSLSWQTVRAPHEPKGGAYTHWWIEKERDFIPKEALDQEETKLDLREFEVKFSRAAQMTSEAFFEDGTVVPLPNGARNPNEPDTWDPAKIQEGLPQVPNGTVLVGIVDTGVSLSNSRFRLPNGQTRFVASWQQSARFNGQSELPCGRELYADDIDAALKEHGASGRLGNVDEIGFNRDLYLTEPKSPGGQRDLEMAAAHGTHVLDLAAGIDPLGNDTTLANRLRLLSVNLPAQYAHGTAGTFLPYFAVYAVQRIIHLANALWLKNNPRNKDGGYPLVINFSYGMTAGPKDGNHIFEQAIRRLLADRQNTDGGKAPVRLIMPAGNDNLERCAASAVLGKDKVIHQPTKYEAQSKIKLDWRIQPSDSTANFVEIWFEEQYWKHLQEIVRDLKLRVTPPGSDTLPLQPLEVGTHQDLGDFARVYVNAKDTGKRFRLALLVCVAPTVLDIPGAPIAPAGKWTIEVLHAGKPVDVTFYIQSDQSAVRTSKTGRRSYFDHHKYQTHLGNGALADTYSYDLNSDQLYDKDNWKWFGPVQRRGTHNALATINDIGSDGNFAVIGGFDNNSGYPAHYSSSADGDDSKPYGRKSISASYPSENGASLFGLLASGARDGSVTSYRGTSMATAVATRDAALAFVHDVGSGQNIATEDWFKKRANAVEDKVKAGALKDHWGQSVEWPKIGYLKSGSGRVNARQSDRRWSRLGGEG